LRVRDLDSCLPRHLILDHAVQIYKNSHPFNITFTVSKYPSETLGQFLKKLRLEKGLEQKELAKRLRVHRNTVYEWENDRKGPSIKGMERLARFFEVRAKILEDFKRRKRRKVRQEG
jgi:DNA-binding XRE family transcriptional regulator